MGPCPALYPRVAGLHTGQVEMSPDFNEPLPDEFWTGEDDVALANMGMDEYARLLEEEDEANTIRNPSSSHSGLAKPTRGDGG